MNAIENNRRFAGILWLILFSLIASFSAAPTRTARALALSPGDIVISATIGPSDSGLMVIDPATGNRSILSDNTTGTGPDFRVPEGVSIAPDGSILVVDQGQYASPGAPGAIYRVDPATGNRTIVSSRSGPGTGEQLSVPWEATQIGGTIYVTNGFSTGGFITGVDAATGDRAVFSSSSALESPIGIIPFNGNLLTVTYFNQKVLEFSVPSATLQFVSGPTFGAGPGFTAPVNLTLGSSGDLFVSNQSPGEIFHVDLLTGDRSILSSSTVGSGPDFADTGPAGIATGRDGSILVNDQTLNAVFQVDPITGNRAILSDATHGIGPSFSNPQGLLVVPNVPEPSTIELLAIGALGLAAMARRRVGE